MWPHQLLSVDDINREQVECLFAVAAAIARDAHNFRKWAENKILACLFFEPSTRTSASFQAAMLKLGGQVLALPDMPRSSSLAKGESIHDTARTMEQFADIIVMRHPEEHGCREASEALQTAAFINAGNGADEDPTQALLDVFTMFREKGRVDGLTVTVVGDPGSSGAVHSLVKLLDKFRDVSVRFVHIFKGGRKRWALSPGPKLSWHENLHEVIGDTDVLYVTRWPIESYDRDCELQSFWTGELLRSPNRVTPELLQTAPLGMCILHPLPRCEELDPRVDADPRACYFKQVRNGLYLRMALLGLMLHTSPSRCKSGSPHTRYDLVSEMVQRHQGKMSKLQS